MTAIELHPAWAVGVARLPAGSARPSGSASGTATGTSASDKRW